MTESKPTMLNHLYSQVRPYSDDLIKKLVIGHYNKVTYHIIEVVDGINISFFCNGMETRAYNETREVQLNYESINFWGNRHGLFQKIIEIQRQLQMPIQLFFTYYGDNLNQHTDIKYTQDKTRNFVLKDIKNLNKSHYLNRADLETICSTHGLTLEVAHRKANLLALKDIKNLSETSLLAAKNGVFDQPVYNYIVKPVTTIVYEERRLIIALEKQKSFICERKIEENLITERLTFDNILSVIEKSPNDSLGEWIISIAQEVYSSLLSENKVVSYPLTKNITARKLTEYSDKMPF